jgi:hypothetical protein
MKLRQKLKFIRKLKNGNGMPLGNEQGRVDEGARIIKFG